MQLVIHHVDHSNLFVRVLLLLFNNFAFMDCTIFQLLIVCRHSILKWSEVVISNSDLLAVRKQYLLTIYCSHSVVSIIC